MRRSAALCVLCVALASLALGLFAGCDEDKGLLVPNNPPSVRLVTHPPDSGTTGYDVEFYWEGWDTDGEVDHFIYAIDPPNMHGSEDSIWTRTDSNSGVFAFQATRFDTLYDWKEPQIAKGWHVFAIKAVDDMGAVSEPDYSAFNAATIAPRTQFTTPIPQLGIDSYTWWPQSVGLRVNFRWRGEDADALFSDGPVRYLYKWIDVSDKKRGQIVSAVWEDTTEWIERGGDERKLSLEFDNGYDYAVAVRAIDEAGAVEPLLLLNGNLMWVKAIETFSYPKLTVRSSAFGRRSYMGWSLDTETFEVPLGSKYEFEVSANANLYGGLITGFSYGWDLEDVEMNETDPEGKGGWTPWSAARTTIRAEFDEYRDYHLHIRVKDDAGGMTLGTIKFRVIALDITKKLCYIDDWRKYPLTHPRGEPLDDNVWQTMLEGYNYGEDWEDVSWDEWENEVWQTDQTTMTMPSLEFLSQFEVVVWSLMDNRSSALTQKSAWYAMNYASTSNVLAVYMTSTSTGGQRGKVWAFGRGLVETPVLAAVGSSCEYPYPVVNDNRCGIKRFTFPMEFMHIRGAFDTHERDNGGARVNLFENTADLPRHVYVDTAGPGIPEHKYTRPPAAELYPNLPPVLPLHPDPRARGWPFYYFEVLEYPEPDQERQDLFYDPVSEEMTDLIPLYRVHANDTNSYAHDKYCGFRYIPSKDTDPAEMVYFFFPMFPFNDPEIRETAKVVLTDWFGLPDPDAAPSASP